MLFSRDRNYKFRDAARTEEDQAYRELYKKLVRIKDKKDDYEDLTKAEQRLYDKHFDIIANMD